MAVNTNSSSLIIGFLEYVSLELEISLKLMEITKQIREDRYYHSLIYMRHDFIDSPDIYNTDQIFKNLMKNDNLAIMNFKGDYSYYLWYHYNRRHMAIVHLNGNEEDKELLRTLWKTLRRNVLSRLILLVRDTKDEDYITKIIKFCTENKALNIMLIKESFQNTNEYYRPQVYPKFKVHKEMIIQNADKKLYPDHVKNMHKYDFRLAMNKVSTKCYIMRMENNNIILGGYSGHFFTEFAKKHNTVLTFPNYGNIKNELNIIGLDKLVENGTYDASAEPTFNLYNSDMVYSDIYDYMDWCLMVPVESAIPAYLFYFLIYDYISLTLILTAFILFSLVLALALYVKGQEMILREFLINIYVLNGLLGQAYKMEPRFSGVRSFVYMFICIGGIIFNTTFVTYLQTFNTSPPTQNAIKTMEDIRISGMKIAVYKQEYAMLDSYDAAASFKPVTKLINSYEEYYALRNNYDKRYIYPVPSAQWLLYEQQQKFFTKPRFRLSDICVVKKFGMVFPLQANSPFEESMNTMIGQVNQAGIVTHWKSLAFLEALRLKRISLIDMSTINTFEPMTLEDMQLLMFVFIFAVSLVCICFFLELYWPHRGLITRKLLHKFNMLYNRNEHF